MVTGEDVRRFALSLPRTYERWVKDRVKFKVGPIVYATVSPDEKSLGFGFPKEERAALVAAEPHKFHMPATRDLRYNWVHVWLAEIDEAEMRELVLDAWRMCVSKAQRAAYDRSVESGQAG